MADMKRVRRVLGLPEQRRPWNECTLALAVAGLLVMLMIILGGLVPVRAEKEAGAADKAAVNKSEKEVLKEIPDAEKEAGGHPDRLAKDAATGKPSSDVIEQKRRTDQAAKIRETGDRQLRKLLEEVSRERDEARRRAHELEVRIHHLEGKINRQEVPSADKAVALLLQLKEHYGPDHPRIRELKKLIELRRAEEHEERQKKHGDGDEQVHEEEFEREIKLFRLKHMGAEQAATIISQMLPQPLTASSEARTNQLVVSAPNNTLHLIESLLLALDVPPEDTAQVFYLEMARAAEAAATLYQLFSDQDGLVKIVPDQRLNALIVQGDRRAVERAAHLIELLDVKSPHELPVQTREQLEQRMREGDMQRRHLAETNEELKQVVVTLLDELQQLREEVRELRKAVPAAPPEADKNESEP